MEENNAYGFVTIPTTNNQKKIVLLLAALLLILFALAFHLRFYQLPEVKPFLPIFITWVFLADFITAILLYSQFRATGNFPLLILASAYCFSSLITIPHIATFPDVFSSAGLWGAGKQTAIYFWVFWHGVFPIGLLIYGIMAARKWKVVSFDKRNLYTLISVLSVILTMAVCYFLALNNPEYLPSIIHQNNYNGLNSSGIGPIVWFINLSALIVLACLIKSKDTLNLWLMLAMLSFFLDVTLTLYSGARYSFGWYLARVNSAFSATIILTVFMVKMNQIFIQLINNQRVLMDSEKHLKEMNEKLKQLSFIDGLTGIANRRRFDEVFINEWKRGSRASSSLSVILFDIDYFKRFNDYYGHQFGDTCLQQVAETLAKSINRPDDFVARYGGEEFVMILPNTGRKGALKIAEKVRRNIEEQNIPHKKSSVSEWVTLSVGVASCIPSPGKSRIHKLISEADQALYAAKKAGRNRVQIY